MKDTYDTPTFYPKKKPQTNPFYSNFTQIYFTVGNEQQFQSARAAHSFKNETEFRAPPSEWEHKFAPIIAPSAHTVQDTFRYIFEKTRKGIFVQIRNGALSVFLPFSNAHFINQWHDKVQQPLPDALKQSSRVKPLPQWTANNYLVRYENPSVEGDLGQPALRHMIDSVCREFKMPDCEFFINRRDFPLLKTDGTEPYDAIFGANHPLVSHHYKAHSPIFSMVESDNFADLALPTAEEWERICARDNVFFPCTKRTTPNFVDNFYHWSEKVARVVWRGTNTGPAMGALRISLCELARDNPLFDVGLTGEQERYHIVRDKGALCIDKNKRTLTHLRRAPMSLREQSKFKYVIVMHGHVQAYRLSAQLAMRSVILLVEGKYRMWFEQKLVPWEHYVPVRADLSNLVEQVDWCMNHEARAECIAQNARTFFETHLERRGIMNFVRERIYAARELTPIMYNYPAPRANITADYWRKFHVQYKLPAFQSPVMGSSRSYLNLALQSRAPRAPFKTPKEIFRSNRASIKRVDALRVIKRREDDLLLHEAAVGTFCINALLQKVPNFACTLGYSELQNTLELEFIAGITLSKYHRGNEFMFSTWLGLLQQVCLALAVGQRECFLTHHDVLPWNIILLPLEREKEYDYLVAPNTVWRATTACIPVIIDYERAFAVHEGRALVAEAPFSTFQDAICLLVSSAHEVLKYQRLFTANCDAIISLFNEVLGGEPIYYTPVTTLDELKVFLETAHKAANLAFSNKGKLEARDPMFLFDALGRALGKVPSCCARADAIEHTNYGKVKNVYSLPAEDLPDLFWRCQMQQLWLMCVNGDPARRALVGEKCARAFDLDDCIFTTDKLSLSALAVLNTIEEMQAIGGEFSLTDEEKAKICAKFGALLEARALFRAQIAV